MRGYVEESEEVKARRKLRDAAIDFAARYLTNRNRFDYDDSPEEAVLARAAVDFAATQPKPKTTRPKRSAVK